jgi:hypothetical protein
MIKNNPNLTIQTRRHIKVCHMVIFINYFFTQKAYETVEENFRALSFCVHAA